MKYFIFTSLIILTLFGCRRKTNDIKVMTWNIWHGGIHGAKQNNFLEDTVNTINTFQVINRFNIAYYLQIYNLFTFFYTIIVYLTYKRSSL